MFSMSEANTWTGTYMSTFILDFFVIEPITSYFKLAFIRD